MPHPSQVGIRVAALRHLAGISARELSALAGLSPSMIGHIETGRVQQPGADTISRIADVLGASLAYIVNGGGQAPTKRRVATSVAAARVRCGQ